MPMLVALRYKDVYRRGGSHLAVGRLRVRSRHTWDEAETSFAVIHYGGLDFFSVLRGDLAPKDFEVLRRQMAPGLNFGNQLLEAEDHPGHACAEGLELHDGG